MTSPTIGLSGKDVRVCYSALAAFAAQDLSVRGNTIGVIGHNGAGKSTLIKTILGLLIPQSGSLTTSLHHLDQRSVLFPERDMAFCPENGSVFADISVAHYMELWSRLRCSHAQYYRNEGKYYLDLLDIHPLLKKKGRELSKGQRRRVQTAIGFMISPRLFLFDEPFDGLDVRRTNQLMEIILKEQSERCFIVSSHRMDVVERIADTVLVLKDGEIVVSGSVDHVCRTLLPAGQPLNLTDAMRYHLTSQEPAVPLSG